MANLKDFDLEQLQAIMGGASRGSYYTVEGLNVVWPFFSETAGRMHPTMPAQYYHFSILHPPGKKGP
jgi:hypothetical protein